VIVDPDLFRLFENTWPSTLDTTVAWRGHAKEKVPLPGEEDPPTNPHAKRAPVKQPDGKEELSFVITGDIEAMWLRDSANQLLAYTSLLKHNRSFDSMASVFRGAINLQARYILEAPFCNAFQAPDESGIPRRSSMNSDQISPSFDYMKTFSCQWELDSVASFLQISAEYAAATGDTEFFGQWQWKEAVKKVLETAESMMMNSYDDEGTWLHTPYTYCAPYGGTPINDCNGSPHRGNIGLVRSFHRPSDDACTYQYLIPSNMMFSVALNESSKIMERIEETGAGGAQALTKQMRKMASGIRDGIEKYGVVRDIKYGEVYAYEVDGYGSANMMDDPNVPSLLSAPYLGYVSRDNKIYKNTRRKILSKDNPYYAWGPVISGVGSPHTLPGKAWPMANIMTILTSDNDSEIVKNLKDLVGSTAGLGLMHESVHSHYEGQFSRQW
jgi:meiotically up-regulated gene 157 (Mug157) protein